MSSSKPSSLAGLSEFQARFTQLLRTPLTGETGRFEANSENYDRQLASLIKPSAHGTGQQRLAVYNRQYWFRLFTTLQTEFPLVSRLFGYHAFNHAVQRFLLEVPPRHFDLGRAADGFCEYQLKHPVPEHLRGAEGVIREALAIDEGFRKVWRSPIAAPFRPGPSDLAVIERSRLVPRLGLVMLGESSALLELRRSLALDPSEQAATLPPRYPEPRDVLVFRNEEGTAQVLLEPLEARLFELLTQHPFSEAISLFGDTYGATLGKGVKGRVRTWVARSVALGFWSGLEPVLEAEIAR